MSLVKSKAIQLGFDATPTNNFLIYQPLTPDGTFRIANGNQGATTDIMTVTSGGSVTFAGTTNFSSLNFGAGSESAPSLFPTGDSNTGIWFPAADTFAVSTGGTERIRVASGGNVGIGTNNPATKLHIAGDARLTGTAPVLTLLRTDSASPSARIRFVGSDNADKWELSSNYLVGGAGFEFNYAGSNTMFLSTGGFLGVGTSSPAGHVNAYTAQGGTSIISTHGVLGSYPKASAMMLGPTSVSYTISNNGSTATFTGAAGMVATNTAASNAPTELLFITTSGGNPAERVRIDSNGNVGIGAPTPGATLDINKSGTLISMRVTNDTYDQWVLQKRRSDNTQLFGIKEASSNGSMSLVTNNTERVRITQDGYVHFGNIQTAANRPLVNISTTAGDTCGYGLSDNTVGLRGRLWWKSDVSNTGVALFNEDNSNLMFGTTGAERMRIAMDGRIYIGNTGQLTSGSNYAITLGESTSLGVLYFGAPRTGTNYGGQTNPIIWGSNGLSIGTDNNNVMKFIRYVTDTSSVTENARFTGAGKFLVGTTTPIAGTANTFRSTDNAGLAVINSTSNTGKITGSLSMTWSAGTSTKYLRISLNSGASITTEVTLRGQYGNFNAEGTIKRVFSAGMNTNNTSIYGDGTVQLYSLGSISTYYSFGTHYKPNNTTYYVPIVGTSLPAVDGLYLIYEICGASLDAIASIDLI